MKKKPSFADGLREMIDLRAALDPNLPATADAEQRRQVQARILCDHEHYSIYCKTKRCIATGEPATTWSGHLIALTYDGGLFEIIAGWKDSETLESHLALRSDGCFGFWRFEHGIEFDFDRWIEGEDGGSISVVPDLPPLSEWPLGQI